MSRKTRLILIYSSCNLLRLEQMRTLVASAPKMDLIASLYIPPYFVSFVSYLATCYLAQSEIPGNLDNLRMVVLAQSRLEAVYSLSFKTRIVWNELLVEKGHNPKSVLGKELSTLMPIGLNADELLNLYQINVDQSNKKQKSTSFLQSEIYFN